MANPQTSECKSTDSGGAVAGLIMLEDFVSPIEEAVLIEFLEQQKTWKRPLIRGTALRRLVTQWSCAYTYNRVRPLEEAPPMPSCIRELAGKVYKALENKGVSPLEPFNQVIVNRYLKDEGIAAHIDHSVFGPVIAAVSLGRTSVIKFCKKSTGVIVEVPKRSCYAMTGDARYKFTHEMPVVRGAVGVRYSITFRSVDFKKVTW